MKSRWTLLDLLNESIHYLSRKAIPNARLDSEILLAHAIGCRRIDLYLRYDQPVNPDELQRFRYQIQRRVRREPVAYITGTKEFWSLPFLVSRSVLIPRPETETLVETAAGVIHNLESENHPVHVMELGTGSGAIAISLARELSGRAKITATDNSVEALKVARLNASTLNVGESVYFLAADLFSGLKPEVGLFSLILSNPPYIPSGAIDHLSPDIRNYEPVDALDGGPDGLTVIQRILDESPEWLMDGGVLLLEVGQGQQPRIEAYGKSPMWKSWEWHQDLQGKDRVLRAKRASRPTAKPDNTKQHHGSNCR